MFPKVSWICLFFTSETKIYRKSYVAVLNYVVESHFELTETLDYTDSSFKNAVIISAIEQQAKKMNKDISTAINFDLIGDVLLKACEQFLSVQSSPWFYRKLEIRYCL